MVDIYVKTDAMIYECGRLDKSINNNYFFDGYRYIRAFSSAFWHFVSILIFDNLRGIRQLGVKQCPFIVCIWYNYNIARSIQHHCSNCANTITMGKSEEGCPEGFPATTWEKVNIIDRFSYSWRHHAAECHTTVSG